jgi:hypothetical protein
VSKGGKKARVKKIGGATRIKNPIDINSFLLSRAVFPNIAMQKEDENPSQYDGDWKNTLLLITLRLSAVQQMLGIINIMMIIIIIIIHYDGRTLGDDFQPFNITS